MITELVTQMINGVNHYTVSLNNHVVYSTAIYLDGKEPTKDDILFAKNLYMNVKNCVGQKRNYYRNIITPK